MAGRDETAEVRQAAFHGVVEAGLTVWGVSGPVTRLGEGPKVRVEQRDELVEKLKAQHGVGVGSRHRHLDTRVLRVPPFVSHACLSRVTRPFSLDVYVSIVHVHSISTRTALHA